MVSVMYQLLSFLLCLPVQIIQVFAPGAVDTESHGDLARVERLDLSPALPDLDLDLQGRLEVVGRDHPVGG